MHDLPSVQAILDSYRDPAILLGDDYRILLANAPYQAVYGDQRELKRRHCYEVSHHYHAPCDLAGEHCPLRECRETGQRSAVLHVHHTPGGLEYVNVETTPIKDASGKITCYIEVMRPSDIAHTRARPEGLVGTSPAFRRMLDAVNRVAPSNTSVLLLGETGTGKEEVAQTIHTRSNTRTGAFVPVECTGLAESLFESELFGHVKGAFTGATMDKTGLVEAAQGGTLFLDEIGDVSLGDQVKLLRLLETRRFRRVGSTQPRVADFRLICATNKNLAERVGAGAFREDLYYRLNVFEIELPALRDRPDDLPMLAETLLRRLDASNEISLSQDALACLEQYPFPGNVRQLRNILERAILMCDGGLILPQHLPASCVSGGMSKPHSGGTKTLAELETEHLRRVVAEHSGDRRSLARTLGISERALYRKLAELRD